VVWGVIGFKRSVFSTISFVTALGKAVTTGVDGQCMDVVFQDRTWNLLRLIGSHQYART